MSSVRLPTLSAPVRAAVLLTAGGVLGWFQAPYNFWWLGFIGFPVFLLILAPLRGWAAFRAGWLFGFGYFLFGLYWIARALFVDIAQFWWALPLAIAGLPMVCAIFIGITAWLTQLFSRPGLSQILVFAACWGLLEWVRGHVFTGFPWLLFGYAFEPGLLLAAAVGAYGLSLLAVLLVSLPTAFFMKSRERWVAGGLMLAIGVSALGWAHYWPAQPAATGATLHLRLVQPDIAQTLKLDPQSREQILQRLLELTAIPGAVDAVIWPETAVPYRLSESEALRQRIAQTLPEGSLLLTGSIRTQGDNFYNSMLAMDKQGHIVGQYDKAHLVPFGEYIPLRNWLPFDPIGGAGEFSAGAGPQSLSFGALPSVSPLICYEVIFPAAVTDPAYRPQWILNITNDAWYGLTNGPHQHLRMAQVRAIEEGLPLVRVANNGVSAVITELGHIQSQLPLGARGVLDTKLTLVSRPTPYFYARNYPFFGFILALLGLGYMLKRRTHLS